MVSCITDNDDNRISLSDAPSISEHTADTWHVEYDDSWEAESRPSAHPPSSTLMSVRPTTSFIEVPILPTRRHGRPCLRSLEDGRNSHKYHPLVLSNLIVGHLLVFAVTCILAHHVAGLRSSGPRLGLVPYRPAQDPYRRLFQPTGRVVPLVGRPCSSTKTADIAARPTFTGTHTRTLNISSYNYLGFAQARGGCADGEEFIKWFNIERAEPGLRMVRSASSSRPRHSSRRHLHDDRIHGF
jgi:hypothetical protein